MTVFKEKKDVLVNMVNGMINRITDANDVFVDPDIMLLEVNCDENTQICFNMDHVISFQVTKKEVKEEGSLF